MEHLKPYHCAQLPDMMENIARVCHAANKEYCLTIGDISQVHWEDAPQWQQDSALRGVLMHLTGEHNAEDSHVAWRKEKEADGWRYGEVKDAINKEHPCIVDFKNLPLEQQAKDHLFRAIVHAFKTVITQR